MELRKIGICPVCGKGQIVVGTLGYSCNYFKTMDDKCTFNIYHTYWNKTITEDIAEQLITKGKTDIFHDFMKKDGTPFSAALVIESGKVVPRFANKTLEHPCPLCGGHIEVLLSGYACTNYNEKNTDGTRKCKLYIPRTIAKRDIPIQAIEALLENRETPFMSGFSSNSGESFAAKLVLTSDGRISFDNTICKCPKCDGNIYMGKKAYNCSNYKNETIKCDFVIWREMSGRKITPEEVLELCENKETKILSGFHDKDGNPMERKLILNDDFKIKLI